MRAFTGAMAGAVIASTLIWREWFKDIFGNVHSQPMFEKTENISGTFFSNILKADKYLYGTPFRNIYFIAFVIICVCLIFVVFSGAMRKKYSSDIRFTLVKIFIAANFNALVVTEMAPDYQKLS